MASESDQKIRRLAIVLQSMDATTARSMLSQFPEAVARAIRRAMVNLGTVDPQERQAAFAELQSLLDRTSKRRSAGEPSVSNSPASQLLANEQELHDSVQFSPEAIRASASVGKIAFATPTSSAHLPLSTEAPWQSLPSHILAELLSHERPIVVATVIHHLPVAFATEVLQQLPVQATTDALSILPSLHSTDAAVLEEILAEMKSKVEQELHSQHQAQSGLAKLREIVAHVPDSQRSLWASSLQQNHPQLVSRLGLLGMSEPSGGEPSPSISLEPQPAAEIAVRLEQQAESGPRSHSRPFQNWQDLLTLEDADLVQILHALEPQCVLLALANANARVLQRIERLIPKRDLQRFRSRLRELRDISLREIDSACDAVLDAAADLVESGQILRSTQHSLSEAA
jgi:flagellar motor switch protein FliG